MRHRPAPPVASLAVVLALAGAGATFAPAACAAPGDLDPSFGRGGQMLTDFDASTDIAHAVALQADGHVVVGGTTYRGNDFSTEDFAIARYRADGTLDPSFGRKGRVTTDFPGLAAQVSAMVVQPDGKIVVCGGAYPLFAFAGESVLARYNVDGTLDAGFGNGGIVLVPSFLGHASYASALALQPDGKIVTAGTVYTAFDFDENVSNTDFAIARYNADGTPDASFGHGGQVLTDFGGLSDDALAVLVQPDGRIVAVGSALTRATYYDFALARYTAAGQLDTTFGTGGRVRTDFGQQAFDRARAAALQPDGRIVAAGFAISPDGGTENFAVVRYRADGSLDPAFGTGGLRQVTFGSCCQMANAVLLQPDGRIVLAGYPDSESSDSDFTLARLMPNGKLDASYGTGGRVRTSFGDLNGGANAAALQPDGKVVAVGFQAMNTPKGAQFALARYLGGP